MTSTHRRSKTIPRCAMKLSTQTTKMIVFNVGHTIMVFDILLLCFQRISDWHNVSDVQKILKTRRTNMENIAKNIKNMLANEIITWQTLENIPHHSLKVHFQLIYYPYIEFHSVLCSAVYSKYKHKISLAFWFLSHAISAIYTLYWDLINDWGLLKTSAKNFLLRDELIYGHGLHNWIYYLAMIEDTILRFAWLAHYFLKTNVWQSAIGHAVLTTAFGLLEILRRFVWNFFRLENEHLNNCGEFRAVRDISIAPLE